jgi:hypothetical protein
VEKGLLERSLVISHWSLVNAVSKINMVSELRRSKASKPYVHTNSNRLYEIPGFAAFPVASVRLKKPSVARSAYWPPMPWGPWPEAEK